MELYGNAQKKYYFVSLAAMYFDIISITAFDTALIRSRLEMSLYYLKLFTTLVEFKSFWK